MLPGIVRVFRVTARWAFAALLTVCVLSPADRGLVPLSVCDVLRDLASHDGQTVAVVGRYSYRTSFRWLDQQGCQAAPSAVPAFWLVEDLEDAPKPPGVIEFNAAELDKKLQEVQEHSPLGKFRFGSNDYDRWAVVYGRVELRKGDDAKKAVASLIIRGNAMIIFLPRP